MRSKILYVILLISPFFISACDLPVQQMEATERGVIFRRLPPFLAGGVSSRIVSGGELTFLWPWDVLIRIDTGTRDVTLGEGGVDQKALQDFLFTRALDGNEVALNITVRYQVESTPASLVRLVREVARSNEEIETLVVAVGRSSIRAFMRLKTFEFLDDTLRYGAVDVVEREMGKKLAPYGIKVLRVMLNQFEFARLQEDGTVDRQYQDRLNEIQRIVQDTEREGLRIETVRADGLQRFNTAQAKVNRLIAEATGYEAQAKARGDSYLKVKANEAEARLSQGKAEAEGLVKQIQALSGPGGRDILKIDLARELKSANPQFFILNGSNNEIGVNKLDKNEIVKQLGLFHGLTEDRKEVSEKEAVKEEN